MFCDNCGLALQDGSKFCPSCGKRSTLDEPVSDQPPEIESPVTENVAKDPEHTLESDSPTSDDSSSLVSVGLNGHLRHANGGSITLGVFGLICFIIGVVQGFHSYFPDCWLGIRRTGMALCGQMAPL